MSISFPDGKEFEVPIEDVVQMTRDERGEYLCALYKNQDLFSNRKSIIAHEYGPEPTR